MAMLFVLTAAQQLVFGSFSQGHIFGSDSLVALIENSPHLSKVFADYVKKMSPAATARVKNLQCRKHRFNSLQKPLGRICLYLDAMISTCVWMCIHRKGQDAERASSYLSKLNNESLLLMAVCADISDETMVFNRFLDTENHDTAHVQLEAQALLSRLHHLIVDKRVVDQGYTFHMITQLQKPRGFLVKSQARTIGGLAHPVPLLDKILQRMAAWLQLACQTVRAEFPSYELLSSFMIFDVEAPEDEEWRFSKQSACQRLAKVFKVDDQGLMDEISNLQPIATQLFISSGKKISSFEAWRDAVRRTRSRKAIAERFPVENLWPVLVRLGAFHGATTSGVEQGLSKLQCNLSPDRCLTLHYLQEVKIICDLPNYEVDWLAEQSRVQWAKWYSAPRKFATVPRLHKGLPQKRKADKGPVSEAVFVRQRRLASQQAPLKPIQERLGQTVKQRQSHAFLFIFIPNDLFV